MKSITIIIEIEVEEEDFSDDKMNNIVNEFENIIGKNGHDLFNSEWYDN